MTRHASSVILIMAAVAVLAGLAVSAGPPSPHVELGVVGDAQLVLAPNGTAVFELTVLVTGEGPNATCQLALDGLPAGWTGLISVDSPEVITGPGGTVVALLDMGRVANVTVAVASGRSPLAGEYPMQLHASVNGTDATDAAALAVSVPQMFQLSMLFDAPDAPASPGDAVEFMGSLRNRGNGPDRVVVECTGAPAGWRVTVDPSEVQLGARAGAILTVQVDVPRELDGTPARDHRFTIRATGGSGATWATAVLTVTIRDYHRVEWALEGVPLTDLDSREARLANVSINPFSPAPSWAPSDLGLLGLGNAAANVTLEASSPVPWLRFEAPATVGPVPPQGATEVQLRVLATADAQAGSYELAINATCAGEPATMRTLRVRVDVVIIDLHVNHIINASGNTVNASCCNATSTMVLGNTMALRCYVFNVGSVDVADGRLHLMYRGPGGGPMVELRSYAVAIASKANANYSFDWTPAEAGSHYFQFVVELANQSSASNDNASLAVGVSGPGPGTVPGPAIADGGAPATVYAMAAILVAAVALLTHRWRVILRSGAGE